MADPERRETVCTTCRGCGIVGGPAYVGGEVYCTSRECPACNGTGRVPEKVPLSCHDVTAQDLLWTYAQRRRAVDGDFADGLEAALRIAGYQPPAPHAVEGVTLDEPALAYIDVHGYDCDGGARLIAQARAALRLAAEVKRLNAVRAAGEDYATVWAERDALRTQLAEARKGAADCAGDEHGKHCPGCAATWACELNTENAALGAQLAVAEARVAELTRVVANYAKQPHRPDCETFRVFGDPCGSVSAWVDPMTGRPTSETRSRPWRCFCGKAEAEAALAPPPPSEGATLLRADDAGGTDAGRR